MHDTTMCLPECYCCCFSVNNKPTHCCDADGVELLHMMFCSSVVVLQQEDASEGRGMSVTNKRVQRASGSMRAKCVMPQPFVLSLYHCQVHAV